MTRGDANAKIQYVSVNMYLLKNRICYIMYANRKLLRPIRLEAHK